MMASDGTGKSASFAAVSSVSALMVANVRPRAAGAAPPEGSPRLEVLPPLPPRRTSGRPKAPLKHKGFFTSHCAEDTAWEALRGSPARACEARLGNDAASMPHELPHSCCPRQGLALRNHIQTEPDSHLGKAAASPPRDPPDWNGAADAFMPPDSKAAAARACAWLAAGAAALSSAAEESAPPSASAYR